jgi:hypothetical protein
LICAVAEIRLYSGPSSFERFDVRTTSNSIRKFEENPVLKLEQKLQNRTKISLNWSKTQSLVGKWHPNIAVVNRSINLFNDIVMQHFRKFEKKKKEVKTNDIKQVSIQRKIKWW